MSKKRELEMALYLKERDQFLSIHTMCLRCGKKATDIHHSKGRIASLLRDQKYWVPLCRKDHDWVGANPNQAREEGLLCPKGQWNTPDRTPLP